MSLTERQADALAEIRNHMAANGCPPTVTELANRLSVTRNAAYEHLKALERKGVVELYGRVSRGIRIVGGCPCCGRELG